jgi:hypothetical protein
METHQIGWRIGPEGYEEMGERRDAYEATGYVRLDGGEPPQWIGDSPRNGFVWAKFP